MCIFIIEVIYVSYRNPVTGTRFIQELCNVLESRGRNENLLSMMTILLRNVATLDNVFSQMPCLTTQLIRLVYFPQKKIKRHKQMSNLLTSSLSGYFL